MAAVLAAPPADAPRSFDPPRAPRRAGPASRPAAAGLSDVK